MARCGLIVVDDIGMLAVCEDAAEGFYRLVDAAASPASPPSDVWQALRFLPATH